MQHSTSNLLKGILASGASVAMALFVTLPAGAHGRHTPRTATTARAAAPVRAAAPARAMRAPVHYAAPARTMRAPVRYAAPARVMRAPVRYAAPARVMRAPVHYAAPARTMRAPVHYAAPARVMRAPVRYAAPARAMRAPRHYAAPARAMRAPRHYAAPARVMRAPVHYAAPARAMRAPRHYAAPVRRYAAPVRGERVVAPAPFIERIAPRREARRTSIAPFVQYVRTAPRARRAIVTRTIAASPLIGAIAAARAPRTIPVAYHPAYLAGRVIEVTRNEVVLQPPTGSTLIVNDVSVPDPTAVLPMGTYVTVPVTYANGGYDLYTSPTYMGSNYATPVSCYSPSQTLYTALLPAIAGAVTGGSNFNTSDLAALALTAVASGSSGNSCASQYGYAPPYPAYSGYPAYNAYPPQYNTYPQYPQYNTYPQYGAYPAYGTSAAYSTYPTPYNNCLWNDDDGDEDTNCASAQPASLYGYGASPYSGYGTYGMYAPQQVQGLVVAKTGNLLMVLGGSGASPVVVDASSAMQNGYALNGPVAVGQVIDAYGFYNGGTFIATTLV